MKKEELVTFAPDHDAPFTETGKSVYERTYSRTKPDGSKETWAETVDRVVTGNLKLVYGDPSGWSAETKEEYRALCDHIYDFKIVPGGRHLWATGVGSRQYLSNCHFAGWGPEPATHHEFTFMRLMEGGGVGANYSSRFLLPLGSPRSGGLEVHIVCDTDHADYQELFEDGSLSCEYVSEWAGCYQIPDTREGWADALGDLIDTFWRDDVLHTKRVYDVSLIRPKGSKIRSFGGTASGPAPLARMLHEVAAVLNRCFLKGEVSPIDAMLIDHYVAVSVVAGGVRRSARMSILHWNDPYIFEFIACKADQSKHWTTNISVEIDDEFIAGLEDPFSKASAVHSAVVAGMLANGEPGYWNSSLSNVGEVERVNGTNPCGEIPLNDWDVCNLGHVNLEAFYNLSVNELRYAHELATRFLIRATFGDFTDPIQAEVVKRNRRIGVGHFGVQGYLAKRGIRYTEAPGSEFADLLGELSDHVRATAARYAFELRIPAPIKTTTVAPTGTTAKMPGATEGIHPVYARWFINRIRFSTDNPSDIAIVDRYRAQGYHVEPCIYAPNTVVVAIPTKNRLVAEVEALGFSPEIVESADEIDFKNMLEFQALYQKSWADNAVSYTCNIPEDKYQASELCVTLKRYLPKVKGVTVMVDGSRDQAPMERITQEQYEAYSYGAVNDDISTDCSTGACPIR